MGHSTRILYITTFACRIKTGSSDEILPPILILCESYRNLNWVDCMPFSTIEIHIIFISLFPDESGSNTMRLSKPVHSSESTTHNGSIRRHWAAVA